MNKTKWFVVMILGIWFIAGIVACVTGNTDPIGTAGFITLLAGVGYLIST